MQTSFSELEYAAKKKQIRRYRFLNEIETVTPWAELESVIAADYPSSGGRGRPPIGLIRMLSMYVAGYRADTLALGVCQRSEAGIRPPPTE